MPHRLLFVALLIGVAPFLSAATPEVPVGEFVHADEPNVSLLLEHDQGPRYVGVLRGPEEQVRFWVVQRENLLEGKTTGFPIRVRLTTKNEMVILYLAEPGMTWEDADVEYFVREGSEEEGVLVETDDPIEEPAEAVVVNGKPLTESQLAAIKELYGVRPRPGRYWYDSMSGLYGVVGYGAYGFMRPGHDLGSLAADASGGTLPISVNGRRLNEQEYIVWSYIVGSWIQPGAYWLDGQGNAGYAGNPIPVINLYQAAMQNRYQGQGSGGDNFWSSRFSAGNSTADGSAGYVSVPGHGPVGYGF